MSKLSNLLEGVHTATSKEKSYCKVFVFDAELNSWIRVDAKEENKSESSEELVIEKDQGGYWLAW